MEHLAVRGLATWRIAHMLMYEAGPYDVLLKFRTSIGIKHDDYDKPFMWPPNNPMYCMWCFSVWIGVALSTAPIKLSLPFALSTIAIIVDDWLKNGESINTDATITR